MLTRVARLFVLATVGCILPTGDCTEIGCTSGLTVHLASLPAVPFRVELEVNGDPDVAYVYECTEMSRCRQDIFYAGLIIKNVRATVTVGGVSRETNVNGIEYRHSHPNGPNCPPDCQNATITVQIPG